MKVLIEIDCDNAAFEPDWQDEVSRILKELAYKLRRVGLPEGLNLHDINGNKVGQMRVD